MASAAILPSPIILEPRKPSGRRFLDAVKTKIGLNPVVNARQRIREIEEHLCLLGFDDEKGCIALLDYAGSSDPSVQLPAFYVIVKAILRNWSIRAIFVDVLDRRGRSAEIVVDSWKEAGVEYKKEWTLYHSLARVCLVDTVVSEALDAVGDAGLDDTMMANLITRSSIDEYQCAFVLGLMFEELSTTQALLRVDRYPSKTFRALASVLVLPKYIGAGPECKARRAVDEVTYELLDAAWRGVNEHGFDLECTGVGFNEEEWKEVLTVVFEVKARKSVFKEAYSVAARNWRGIIRARVESNPYSGTASRRDDAPSSVYRRLIRLTPGAE